MEFDILVNDNKYLVSIQKKGEDYEIKINDEAIFVSSVNIFENIVNLKHEGVDRNIHFAGNRDLLYMQIDGEQYQVRDIAHMEQQSAARDQMTQDTELEICAPMPGKILKIFVKEGERISPKQNLVIVEAMKMENSIVSMGEGIVRKINFKEGDVVDTGQPIIELEPVD